MADSARNFPQYLSRPFQVLWAELDELAIFLSLLTMALIYGGFAWFVFVVGQYFYSRMKRRRPRGFLKHVLYMCGFISMKNYPDYFQKEFHE